jgi:hypothetical protein
VACVGLHWPPLHFVGLRWPSLACVGPRWHLLAFIGFRWPALALVGLRWPSLALVGLHWPALGCHSWCGSSLFVIVVSNMLNLKEKETYLRPKRHLSTSLGPFFCMTPPIRSKSCPADAKPLQLAFAAREGYP